MDTFLVFHAEGFEPTYTKDGQYGITIFQRKRGLSINHPIKVIGSCTDLLSAKQMIGAYLEPKVEEPTLFLGTENPTKGKTLKKRAKKNVDE
jgi:hypothetical protein